MFFGLEPSALLAIIIVMMLAGVAIGFLAGLFGVGGGAVSVPIFFEIFRLSGQLDDIAMPLAVGSSLAMIVPTSLLSAREHAEKGTVDVGVLRRWALPILCGVLLGSLLAREAGAEVFQLVFLVVAVTLSLRMLLGGTQWQIAESLPARGLMTLYGGVIGLLSTLMGIGGGALSTMALTLHGFAIHRAVSTSAGVGVLIAVPGTVGYVAAGWGRPELPADAIGYVSTLALLITLPTTLLLTRVGVRVAHSLSRQQLTRLFGAFLLLVAFRFFLAVFVGI